MSRLPFTDDEGEIRELSLEDFGNARPISEVDPGLADAVKAIRNESGKPNSRLDNMLRKAVPKGKR